MNPSRRQKIEAMLADDPHDTFLIYALATEMRNAGEVEPCLAKLNQLAKLDTPYIPAFFLMGKVLTDAGRIADARSALREGIEQARAQSDFHAAGEMSEFLAELGAAGE